MAAPKAARPRKPHPEDWKPNPGPQERFLGLTCFEALYGGAAGGGKSDCLLVDAIRYVGRGYGSAYHAILFRRTYPELQKSLIKRSHELYPRLGGRFNKNEHVWVFPGGELVEFAHIQYETDVHNYQGAAFQFIGFDELTTFLESQYLYLFSRCRSANGIRCRIRGATNPGGEGHEWVFGRFGPWLDPKADRHAGPGEVLYFVKPSPTESDRIVEKGTEFAKGRTFIPARLEDNPYLFDDGQYESTLRQLDLVNYERLRKGDWLIQPAKGLYFKREYFADRFIDAAPKSVLSRVRYWDRAASVDGDWTVGARISRTRERLIVVEDVARFRGDPAAVEARIKATADADGRGVVQCLEQDPGAAGKAEISYLTRSLQGFNVRAFPKRVNKIVAAGPFSAQCAAGNVRVVRGVWNADWLTELEQFPEGAYDDQVDASSGGFTAVIGTGDSSSKPSQETQPSYEDRGVG